MNIQTEWKRISPNLEPIAYLLKQAYPDRWVRFHNLPNSKRYPETEAEYQTIIERNRKVLLSVISESIEMTAFSAQYVDDQLALPPNPEFAALTHKTEFYGTVTSVLDPEVKLDIHFGTISISRIPDLIRLVADEVLANIILVCFASGVIYHPYDGGMDFILKTRTDREALKDKFIEWYPSSTGGL